MENCILIYQIEIEKNNDVRKIIVKIMHVNIIYKYNYNNIDSHKRYACKRKDIVR
jgi:hypothetical protein